MTSEKTKGSRSDAERAARSDAVGHVGRAGLVARGVVWVVAGGIAALVAAGGEQGGAAASGGSAGGSGAGDATTTGALRSLAGDTPGRLLLATLALGLAAFTVWSVVRVLVDRRDTGVWSRAAAGVQAVIYGGLCFLAARLVLTASSGGSGGSGSDQQAQGVTARLLSAPAGQVVAVVLGLLIVAVGVGMVVYGVRRSFLDHWREAGTPSGARHAAEVLGVVGYGARGLVYAGSGAFVTAAALTADPDKARGLDGTLSVLVSQPFGPWLLAVVALGFVAYGVFSVVEARYAEV